MLPNRVNRIYSPRQRGGTGGLKCGKSGELLHIRQASHSSHRGKGILSLIAFKLRNMSREDDGEKPSVRAHRTAMLVHMLSFFFSVPLLLLRLPLTTLLHHPITSRSPSRYLLNPSCQITLSRRRLRSLRFLQFQSDQQTILCFVASLPPPGPSSTSSFEAHIITPFLHPGRVHTNIAPFPSAISDFPDSIHS